MVGRWGRGTWGVAGLALGLALQACSVAPASTASRARPVRPPLTSQAVAVPPGAVPSPADAKPVLPVGPGPAGLPTTAPLLPGAGVISNNSGSLVGVLRAPASLLSNNSGSLVSNNGGAYRLLTALDERPVAGVRVALQDATGQPVLGADGQPLVATTDAQGRYAFQGALPRHTLLLAVPLPGDKGTLRALVPKEGEAKVVDAHLVSSLTTTYILEQYLSQAPEKQVALDRLSESVLVATGAKAGAAFTAVQAGVPAVLNGEASRATVDAMRAGDAAFRAQMEAVKQLLIVAGQSGRGEGRLASEVSLEYSTGMGVGADGSVYLSSYENRVWRVRPDGVLVTVAGGPSGQVPEAIEGKLATEVVLGGVSGVGADAQGLPLVMADGRLFRVKADGRVQVLCADLPGGGSGFAAGPDGRVWLLGGGTWGENSLLELPAEGGTPRLLCRLQKGSMDRIESFGRHASGAIFVRVYWGGDWDEEGRPKPGVKRGPQVCQVDPSSGALTPIAGVPEDAHVDASGHVLWGANGRLMALEGPGQSPKDLGPIPEEATQEYLAMGPQGEGYVASYYQLYRVKGGAATRWAGTDPKAAASGNAADYGFQDPVAIATLPDGTRFVSDKGKGQLLRINAAGQISTVPLPADPFSDEGGGGGHPILRVGPGQQLYGLSPSFIQGGIHVISEAGGLTERVAGEGGFEIHDFVVAADGTLYFTRGRWSPRSLQFLKQGPSDEAPTVLHELEYGIGGCGLALDGEGRVLLLNPGGHGDEESPPEAAGRKGLLRFTPSNGALELLAAQAPFNLPGDPNDSSIRVSMAVDAQGRILGIAGNTLVRFDLGTKQNTTLAGVGGRIFTGSGVDDGLLDPCAPVFDAEGGLLLVDQGHRQIKRIPPEKLQ